MEESEIKELVDAIENNPEGIRASQIIDGLTWDVLDCNDSGKLEEQLADIARKVFAKCWQGKYMLYERRQMWYSMWYAGQLMGLAGVLHARLSRKLSLEREKNPLDRFRFNDEKHP